MSSLRHHRLASIAAAVALAAGCESAPHHTPAGVGRAALSVSVEALSAANVDTVTVTIQLVGSATAPIVQNLTSGASAGQPWTAVVGEIPAGSESFTVVASGMGTPLYQGQQDVTINEGQTAMVMMLLQQIAAPSPFVDSAPVIDSVFTGSDAVGPSVTGTTPFVSTVGMGATAHDVDVGDTDTFAWSDDSGRTSAVAFSPSGSTFTGGASEGASNTTWTAPTAAGTYHVTVTVTDSFNEMAAVTFAITVSAADATGTADISISVNTWPTVSGITASADRVDVSQTTDLTVNAADADGDTLSYAWTDDCSGMFVDATVVNPTWQAPATAPMSGVCTLSVAVNDGRGGTNSGALTLEIGPAPAVAIAPVITEAFAGGVPGAPPGQFTLNVSATDPQGNPLTFNWGAAVPADGTMGTPQTFSGSSSVTFAMGMAASYTITVTVSDMLANLSTLYTFTVTAP